MAEIYYDEPDKTPSGARVTYCDFIMLLYSIVFHFIDVGYDYYTAVVYFTSEKYIYFGWTMAFILLPAIVTSLVSIRMYVIDSEDPVSTKRSNIRIGLCVGGLVFQSAAVIRHIDSFYYAVQSFKAEKQSIESIEPNIYRGKQKKYYNKMLKEDSDAALLKVLECYLESAPQILLQITLLLMDYIEGSFIHNNIQLASIVIGFISMSFCMVTYKRCIRFDQENKKNMSVSGTAIQFFLHLNITVSRILAISSMAALYPFWTCVAAAFHWFAMTVWITVTSGTLFCGRQIFEVFFSSAFGLVYIFNFINLRDGPTRMYYVIFYSVCFVENVISVTIWGVYSAHVFKNWSYYIFIIFPIVCILLSLLLLVIYYKMFHPNKLKNSLHSEERTFLGENLQSVDEQRVPNLHTH